MSSRSDHQPFIDAIRASADNMPIFVYADFLDDIGESAKASFIREGLFAEQNGRWTTEQRMEYRRMVMSHLASDHQRRVEQERA